MPLKQAGVTLLTPFTRATDVRLFNREVEELIADLEPVIGGGSVCEKEWLLLVSLS